MTRKRFMKLAAIGTAIAGFVLFWRKHQHAEDGGGPATPGPAEAHE
jgi:hypothetical protein